MNYLCFLKLWKALSDGKFCLLSLSTLNGTPPKGDLIKLCSETLKRGWMISEVQAHCIEWLSSYSHFNITTSISSQKDFKINEKTKKSWLEQVYQPSQQSEICTFQEMSLWGLERSRQSKESIIILDIHSMQHNAYTVCTLYIYAACRSYSKIP